MYNPDAMKDTLRVLVSWSCNLNCSYCCNKLPEIRSGIRPARLEDLDFSPYKVVCITGGEPLLDMERVRFVCGAAYGKFVVLYTNGILMTPGKARRLREWGVDAINVGLHNPLTFDVVIRRVLESTATENLSVRFHLEDIHKEVASFYPRVQFRFWHRDECERGNEDRVILEG